MDAIEIPAWLRNVKPLEIDLDEGETLEELAALAALLDDLDNDDC